MRAAKIVLAAAMFLTGLMPVAAWADPATNDDFDAAVAVTEIPFSHVVLTNEATKAPDDPDCSSGGRTVWYRFVPAVAGRFDVHTFASNYDTTLAVYTGSRGSLVEVGCNDDSSGRQQSALRFEAQAGESYHVMVGSLATGARGTLKISISQAPSPPANDDRASAERVTKLPYVAEENGSAATAAADDPDCPDDGKTVWYSFTAGRTQQLRATVADRSSQWFLGVYRSEGGDLREIACSSETVSFETQPGTDYLFVVSSHYSYAGTYRFSLDVAPPPLLATVHLDKTGRVSRVTGHAVITGRVTCSAEADVYLSGVIRQRRKQRVVSARFDRALECKPGAKHADDRVWRLRISAGDWAFHRGLASVDLAMTATGTEDRVKRALRRTVGLRPCACA